jgi:hypothetical protein
MKRQLTIAICLAALFGYAHAQNEVYLCVSADGTKEYKNTGATRGCKKVDLPDITTIPAPAKRASTQTASARNGASSDFPRIDGDTQKARDNDRRQILMDEMKTEEQKLANLKKEFNNGEPERHGDERNYAKYQDRVASMKEDIERSEKNVEALKREIGNLK